MSQSSSTRSHRLASMWRVVQIRNGLVTGNLRRTPCRRSSAPGNSGIPMRNFASLLMRFLLSKRYSVLNRRKPRRSRRKPGASLLSDGARQSAAALNHPPPRVTGSEADARPWWSVTATPDNGYTGPVRTPTHSRSCRAAHALSPPSDAPILCAPRWSGRTIRLIQGLHGSPRRPGRRHEARRGGYQRFKNLRIVVVRGGIRKAQLSDAYPSAAQRGIGTCDGNGNGER